MAPGRVKHKKKDHWDNARARFAALKVLDRSIVDLSKLLIGGKLLPGRRTVCAMGSTRRCMLLLST
jgi:hypothetical protein